jgi:putative toxin-antitoxin system antitoxin component (TIGR02293 family)
MTLSAAKTKTIAVPKAVTTIKGLSTQIANKDQMHTLIKLGMPIRIADNLKSLLSLGDSGLAKILGITSKTLQRKRKARTTLTPVESDRLYRVQVIFALAIKVLGTPQDAKEWLSTPQIDLGDRVPLDLLTTSAGASLVEEVLNRMEYGILA